MSMAMATQDPLGYTIFRVFAVCHQVTQNLAGAQQVTFEIPQLNVENLFTKCGSSLQ